jgi:hypothetical protein
MGGLDSIADLLWSPVYTAVLLLVIAATGAVLRSVARVAFERVGVWKAMAGTFLMLCWALLLSVIQSGPTALAWQAFAVAAYFTLVSAALVCLPMAVMLARIDKYRIGWFVGLVTSGVLLLALLAEMAIGPEVSHGVNRWLASVLPICGYVGPAIAAFAIGARIPLR